MNLFKRKTSKENRDQLLETMQLPDYIRHVSEEERKEIIKKKIMQIKEILENMKCKNDEYELSKRQQRTKELAIYNIKQKDYLEAYFEMIDFIEDYGDKHDGKVWEKEKQEINQLIEMIGENVR